MLRKLLKSAFNKAGFELTRIDTAIDGKTSLAFTMEAALDRCIKRGLNIQTVIDVGASDSQWSRMCINRIPKANYLLIEAQEGHRNSLDRFKEENSNVDFVLAAAGRSEGKIYFDNEDLFGGVASEKPLAKNCIEVPVVAIDSEVRNRKLQGPFLIKLDTHGFEVPILEGATETLQGAELVIIETYNYRLTNDSLKFHQMCSYMEERGFSTIEVADFVLRKHDLSFWQMDTFFVPSKRKEFSFNQFQ